MLIGLILLQRGRGGGLVGALSGLGGQSAFGTKAGDTFTRITIAIAAIWVLLAGIHGQVLRAKTEKFKNETTTKEVGSSSKDEEGSATKSDDTKKQESGLGSSSDSPKKSRSDEPAKEISPDDDKKSEAAPKTKEPPKKDLEEPADGKSDDKSGEKK